MSNHATGTVAMQSWDEAPWNEVDGGGKMTRATVVNTFDGDIRGEGFLQYLMTYRGDSFATFTGMERVVASVQGRSGTFVLQHDGTFEDGVVRGVWSVIPGSGTGDLAGLTGAGSYLWAGEHADAVEYTLDYDFA